MDILFIGNSHVYMHFMPQMLEALVKAAGGRRVLTTGQCTGEGVSLEWHWNNPATRDFLASKQWDYVVLQDRAGGPLEERASFENAARLLDQEIKRQAAQTVLYMTWALKSEAQAQTRLAAAYGHLADRLGAKLAPVGLAWEKAQQVHPKIDLFLADGRHANPAGAYLTACVFFALLFESSPVGLPGKLTINGKKRVDLEAEHALMLQKIAATTVSGTQDGKRNT